MWNVDNLESAGHIPPSDNDSISSIAVTSKHVFTGGQTKNIKMWEINF